MKCSVYSILRKVSHFGRKHRVESCLFDKYRGHVMHAEVCLSTDLSSNVFIHFYSLPAYSVHPTLKAYNIEEEHMQLFKQTLFLIKLMLM